MSETTTFNKSFILFGLIALFVIPELNNVHYDPQPQFWAEMTVAWAILGLFSFILWRSRERICIPFVVLPLGLLALYLCLQPLILANIDFPGLNYVSALELLLCIFLAISISTIKNTYGLRYMLTSLSYALLIGAILQTLIGFIQYTGTTSYFGDMIFYDSSHPTTNIFGHFGQRNHYAHYLSWGTFGLIYLYQQRRLSAKLFYPLLLWMSFSLTISASRSVFIYFALALIFSGSFYFIKRNRESKRLFCLIACATIALFAFEYFYPLIHKLFTTHNNFSSGLGRIDSESGTGRRGVEWDKAWLVFKSYPILGYGWNGYAKQSVLLHPLFPNAALNSGLFTNCHNLVLQLLAETGLIGAGIVIFGIIYAIYRLLRGSASVESVILLCMIGTTLSHSLNEYPLWYMYFLAGLVTFLAMDKPLVIIGVNKIRALAALPIIGCAYLMVSGSIIFDTLVNYYDTPDDQATFTKQAKYLQNIVDHNQLWAYFGIYTLDNYIDVDSDATNKLYSLPTQYYYTHKLNTFHPYPDTMTKEAMLDWKLGNHDAAIAMVKLDLIAFPVYKASFKDTLKDPQYKELYQLVK